MINLKRRLATGAISTVFVAAGAVGLAPGASADTVNETPQAATAVALAEFECGPNNWVGKLVPDNPPGAADFHPACVAHDECYSTGSSTSRLSCDTAFLTRMRSACNATGQGSGSFCYGVAATYHYVVRNYGGSFYKGSGSNA